MEVDCLRLIWPGGVRVVKEIISCLAYCFAGMIHFMYKLFFVQRPIRYRLLVREVTG